MPCVVLSPADRVKLAGCDRRLSLPAEACAKHTVRLARQQDKRAAATRWLKI